MQNPDQDTITTFAGRSDRTVMRIALAFALGGACAEIGASAISSIYMNGSYLPAIWGFWIPLCFLTIPPIHYLCRHVQRLQERIDALEAQVSQRHVA